MLLFSKKYMKLCILLALGCFYAFSIVYLRANSIDFIARDRLVGERERLKAVAAGPIYELGTHLPVGRSPQFAYGWSIIERTGVWTVGSRSTVALLIGNPLDGDLHLIVRALAHTDPNKNQVVKVRANGRETATWTFETTDGWVEKSATIAREMLRSDGFLRLDFEICCSRKPGPLDPRLLGIHIAEFRISVD
jgi:hypothetical protein